MSIAEDTLKSTADVELDGRRHHISWPRQSTLVDVMLAAGIDVPTHVARGAAARVCAPSFPARSTWHTVTYSIPQTVRPASSWPAGPDPSPTSCTSRFDGSLSSADRDCCGANDAGCGRP